MKPTALAQLLNSSPNFTSVLLVAVIDTLGTDALDWDIETIAAELRDSAGGVALDGGDMGRIGVGIALLRTDRFYHDLSFFIHACNMMSGRPYNPMVYETPELVEIGLATTEVGLLVHNAELKFTEEINGFVRSLIAVAGIGLGGVVPASLRMFTSDVQSDPSDIGSDPIFVAAVMDASRNITNDVDSTVKIAGDALVRKLSALELENSTGRLHELLAETAPSF